MTLQEKIQNKAEGFGKLAPVFLEGVKFALENQFISVEDDLPCNHEELLKTKGSYRTKSVIVRFDDNMHGFMYMVKIPNKWRWKWHTAKITGITHWMPIPELSKD